MHQHFLAYLFSGETGTLLESPQPPRLLSSLTLPSSASLAAEVEMVEARLNLLCPLDDDGGGDVEDA